MTAEERDELARVLDAQMGPTPDGMYYDREGKPITSGQWIALLEWSHEDEEGFAYRRVAFTELPNMEVSTVWLGLNHEWRPGYPPKIFETMVFVELQPDEVEVNSITGDLIEHNGTEMWRWSTEAEAIAGHDQVVASLRVDERPR